MGLDNDERRTLILVNLAGIMERADEAILPAVYKEVGAALHASPTGLGSLTLLRCIVQTFCYPLAAYMAVRYDRSFVISIGAFLWAGATFLVAISNTFIQVAISRALNGIGLALVVPSIQSLVADSTDETTRGLAFGWLQFAGNFGAIIGNFMALLLASTSFMGIAGWRIAFHLVAIISVVVGILVRIFAVDPHFSKNSSSDSKLKPKEPMLKELKHVIKEAKAVMKVPSFQIIVAQGITGSFPWSALSFAPMWLELVGFSHKDTALFMTLFQITSSVGSLFGGKMGDFLAKHFPNAGRIILSQISAGSCIPLSGVLLLGLPYDPSTGFAHALVLFIMGFTTSWNAPATNNPIFAEIVPERSRTSIYALDRSFESTLASFAPPLVGILAQHVFSYKPAPNESNGGETMQSDRKNAASLAKALYTAIIIPMTLCVSIYSFLYCTYPRDRERARMDALIASEIHQIELETSHGVETDMKLQISEIDNFVEERTVIDMDYVVEDFDIDDADEITLLSKNAVSSDAKELKI